MKVLLDTNVLARMAQPGTAACQVAHDAANALSGRGGDLYVIPQVLYELWVVATRPVAANGLGFGPAQAASELTRVLALFPFLSDEAAIFGEWHHLVLTHQVSGKSAHD